MNISTTGMVREIDNPVGLEGKILNEGGNLGVFEHKKGSFAQGDPHIRCFFLRLI